MANAFDFLMSDWGDWSAEIPSQDQWPQDVDFTYGTQPDLQDWGLPSFAYPIDVEEELDPLNADYWGSDAGAGALNWIQVVAPLAQLVQNNEQFRTEFNEAQRRFNEQFAWTRARDDFQMRLSERQQSAEEAQAEAQQRNTERQLTETELNNVTARDVAQRQMSLQELQQAVQSGQWERSFAAQQRNDEHARNLADQRLAFEISQSDRELDLQEQQAIWLREYRNAQIANEQEALRVQERVANVQAFGRSQAPGQGRWISQWG